MQRLRLFEEESLCVEGSFGLLTGSGEGRRVRKELFPILLYVSIPFYLRELVMHIVLSVDLLQQGVVVVWLIDVEVLVLQSLGRQHGITIN